MRLLDGLGYRFYWATEGLIDADYRYSPGEDCHSIGDLVKHIWDLANWIHLNLLDRGPVVARSEDTAEARDQVLDTLEAVRQHVSGISEEELFRSTIRGKPFWHIVNGPVSDALTHTGQIASYRRLNGNPVPEHHVFLCHEKG